EKVSGTLHVTERYSVIASDETFIWIEMSTRYGGQGDFISHHRMRVSVKRCLEAYRNPVQRKPWSFLLYNRGPDGSWQKVGIQGKTLAFEEKFNCDPNRYENSRINRL